jgi:uncharacterized protein YdaU (DUF1376 family)
MHYYQFNIADYRKDTGHLSPMEHYIYRELIDWYYLDEKPITQNNPGVLRRLRLGSENENSLINVLQEFFVLEGEFWVHGRIEREISYFHRKSEAARVNGSKGGRPPKPKKTKVVNLANPTLTQKKADAKLTNNHKPITNIHSDAGASPRKNFTPPTTETVSEYLREKSITHFTAEHFVDFYQARGWKLSSGTKMSDWKAAVRTWDSRRKAESLSTQNTPFAGAL